MRMVVVLPMAPSGTDTSSLVTGPAEASAWTDGDDTVEWNRGMDWKAWGRRPLGMTIWILGLWCFAFGVSKVGVLGTVIAPRLSLDVIEVLLSDDHLVSPFVHIPMMFVLIDLVSEVLLGRFILSECCVPLFGG